MELSEWQLWEWQLWEWQLWKWQLWEWQLWEWQLWEWQLWEWWTEEVVRISGLFFCASITFSIFNPLFIPSYSMSYFILFYGCLSMHKYFAY